MARRVVIFGWAGSVHVQRWARGLVSRGYEVRVISLGDEPIDGIDTVILPRQGKFSYYLQASAAVKAARDFQPDIVHVHYAAGFGLWALKTGLRPVIVSAWGSDIVDLPNSFYYRRIVRKVLRGADHVTATSQMLKEATLEHIPGKDDSISVVPFGVNVPAEISPLPGGPVRLCFIKNHKWIYGPDLLLKALLEVRKQIPGVWLTMAGDGPVTAELKALAAQLGLDNCVDFPGFIPNERIHSFIAEHHMVVMPSLKEAFGVAALDAGAAGRSVIATTVGGLREVVRDGETGILIPAGEVEALVQAIIRLAGDVELMNKMGRAGHEFVKNNYTWDKSLDLMCELYERLIDEKEKA